MAAEADDPNDDSENESHRLVEESFGLMEEKLEQDEVTVDDMEEVYEALEEACDHPESDIWTTITALGPKNQVRHHLPDSGYEYPPGETPRECLEGIVNHTVEVSVS